MRLKNLLYPVIIAPAWIPEMNAVQHTETGEQKRGRTPVRWVGTPWNNKEGVKENPQIKDCFHYTFHKSICYTFPIFPQEIKQVLCKKLSWGCLAQRKGGSGVTFTLSRTPWKEGVARWGSVSSPRVTSDRTGGNCLRLCQEIFRLASGRISSLESVV